jgi:flagellar biosynthesis protein FlhF
MKVKNFRARTVQEAMAAVRDELGPDAMILSTRRVQKSPRDPYAHRMFEIEAASKAPAPKDKVADFKNHGRYGGEADSDQTSDPIRNELAAIKDMISLLGVDNDLGSVLGNHSACAAILASLLRAGVSERMARGLVKRGFEAMEVQGGGAASGSVLKRYVLKECLRQISVVEPFAKERESPGTPHAAAFVGPTGVGKTTTIAKLAARLRFKDKKRVGLISIDSYRMGAFEQLKAYGTIMGVMCLPAYSGTDLVNALGKMEQMDIVLIDTAGHSPRDTPRMEEVAGVLGDRSKLSVHLVLSVTTGFDNMRESAKAFSALDPESYIFTKIDETRQCGKILDQLGDLRLPVSFVTNGQRVPEDLIVPDPRDLLGIILGRERE